MAALLPKKPDLWSQNQSHFNTMEQTLYGASMASFPSSGACLPLTCRNWSFSTSYVHRAGFGTGFLAGVGISCSVGAPNYRLPPKRDALKSVCSLKIQTSTSLLLKPSSTTRVPGEEKMVRFLPDELWCNCPSVPASGLSVRPSPCWAIHRSG